VEIICKPSLLPSFGSDNFPLMEARADEFPMNFEERAHFWRSSQGFRVLVANFAEHRLQKLFGKS
jgi:hypothetical protein